MLYLVPHRIENIPGLRAGYAPATAQQPGQGCISALQHAPDGAVIGGCYLMWLPAGTSDAGCEKIADDPREAMRVASRNTIGTRFSLTPDATTVNGFIKELLADRLWCGGALLPNYRTLKREIILGRFGEIWSEGVAPREASVGYTEDWRTTGTDVTTAQKFNAVYSVAWANIAEQFGAGGTGSPSISSATPNRLTNVHVTVNLQVMTALSAIADTNDNEISMSARIVTGGANVGIFTLARFNSAGHTGYVQQWDRSGALRNRASYAISGAITTLDDSGADPGAGVQSVGVSCSGSTISWTRPGTDYSTTDTNVATGRYGGLFIAGGASAITAETYGDVIWQDVGFSGSASIVPVVMNQYRQRRG